MSFKNYLKFYLKIMPLITIITLSLVTQGALYGQSEEEEIFFEAVKKGDIAQTKKSLEDMRVLSSYYGPRISNYSLAIITNTPGAEYTTYVTTDIGNEADYNKTALMYAVSNRDIEMINLLLSYDAEVDVKSDEIIGHPIKTVSPIKLAIYNDDLDIVEIFSEFLYKESRDKDSDYYSSRTVKNVSDFIRKLSYYYPKVKRAYNFAKELGRLDIVKYFDDNGYFITEKDQQIGDLTEEKINRYKNMFGTITQSDFDRAVSSYDFPELSPHMVSNKSFILYLKKCVDINFTIDHIDNIVKENPFNHGYFWDEPDWGGYIDEELYDEIIVDQIRFIMDVYNISADVTELAIINIIRDNFSSAYKQLLNMLFERGYNPNLITLGEPDKFFGIVMGHDTDFEDYVYQHQVAYNRNQRAKEEELRKAELKAQKEAAKATKLAEKEATKEEKRLAKEAKKANKLTEKRLAKEAKLAEKERKRLEKEMKKTAKLTEE